MKADQVKLKEFVRGSIETHIQKLFVEAHESVNSTSGDISIEQETKISNAIDMLTDVIVEQTFENKTRSLVSDLNVLASLETNNAVPLDEEMMDYHVNFDSLMRIAKILSDRAVDNFKLKQYLTLAIIDDFHHILYRTGDLYLCPPISNCFTEMVTLVRTLREKKIL